MQPKFASFLRQNYKKKQKEARFYLTSFYFNLFF